MASNEDAMVIVHDIRGQICPSCLLFTLRELNKEQQALKDEKVVLIIKTDNRNAIATIPEAVVSMGYSAAVEKKEGYYQIEIRASRKKTC